VIDGGALKASAPSANCPRSKLHDLLTEPSLVIGRIKDYTKKLHIGWNLRVNDSKWAAQTVPSGGQCYGSAYC